MELIVSVSLIKNNLGWHAYCSVVAVQKMISSLNKIIRVSCLGRVWGGRFCDILGVSNVWAVVN